MPNLTDRPITMRPNRVLARRCRIAHITTGLDTGGLEKLLLEFARHADRSRFDLAFLSLTTRGRLADEIGAQGWPVIALEEPPGFRPSIAWHLGSWLRRLGTDVVHTHDSRPLIYGAPAAKLAGVPRLIHMRHFARLATLTGRQIWLAQMAARLVDDYVCVSRESAVAAASEGIPRDRLRTVWNGIDVKRFAYAGPNPQGPLVTVARLSPEKDLATLLRAVAIIVREQPTLRLEVAGDGPSLPGLKGLAKELAIESHVTFLGEVRDVATLLKKARCFVLPSLTEGVSLTLLEAMASGLPVVATDVGGNPEVVQDGITGLLVPAGNPPALARAILELVGDVPRCRQLGRAGRERVEQHFDVRRMVLDYEEMYSTRAG